MRVTLRRLQTVWFRLSAPQTGTRRGCAKGDSGVTLNEVLRRLRSPVQIEAGCGGENSRVGSDGVGQVASGTAVNGPPPAPASLLSSGNGGFLPRLWGRRGFSGILVPSALEDSRPSAGLSDLPPHPARPQRSLFSPLVTGGSPALGLLMRGAGVFAASLLFALENWVQGSRKGGGRLVYV